MNVTPFLLLKRSTVELLTGRADAALKRWCAAWPSLPDSGVLCTAVTDKQGNIATAAEWRPRPLPDGTSVWISQPAGFDRSLGQLLFGVNELDATSEKHMPSAIASDIAQDALEELMAGLIHALTDQISESTSSVQAALPGQLFRPGSGAVLCTVSLGDMVIRILLPASAMPFTLPALAKQAGLRPPLSSLQHALAKVSIKLSVEVSQAELTLGYLRTLCVGDVLFLPTGIDQAMRVTGPGGTTVCHAHLGTKDGFHAIELIK